MLEPDGRPHVQALVGADEHRTGYHDPSEVIPSVLALGEKHHLSGKDVITAINLAYDLSLCVPGRRQGRRHGEKGLER